MIKDLKIIDCYPYKSDIILPVKVLLSTKGVSSSENLLNIRDSQPNCYEKPEVVFSTEGGKKAAVLLDFGSEFTGGLQIVSKAGNHGGGNKMHIRFGESAAEAMTELGVKGACNDHSERDFFVSVPWYSCAVYGASAFRYAYIELTEPETVFEVSAIQGVFTYRDLPYLGSFISSDETLNRIYDTSAYTVHLCMRKLLWDGAKRDRLVWIGDMHPEVLAIRSVFGYNEVVDNSLRYIARTNPIPDYPNGYSTYGMWYIMILADWYKATGRKELLEELKEYWKPLLNNLADSVNDRGEPLPEENLARGYFLDWPTNEEPEAAAGVYALLSLALKTGAELIKDGDILKEKCIRKANKLDGASLPYRNKKQVVAMMNLAGHLDSSEAGKLLTENGGHGMSTFMSYYILSAAAKSAGVSAANGMLKEYYGAMLDLGATTFFEDFDLDWVKSGAHLSNIPEENKYDIHGDNGKYCYVGFRHSLCHGWSSGPAAYLAENVLGVKILEPGCKKVSIKPCLEGLSFVKGTYPTPYGIISVNAEVKNGKTTVQIDAPKEIEIV